MKSSRDGFTWSFLFLICLILLPSTYIFQKYLGLIGVVGYIVYAILIFLAGYKIFFKRLLLALSQRWAIMLIITTLLLFTILFFLIYPIANSGIVGRGSDGDDALNIATTELLKGNYPYYLKTYLDNPISPMPGSLLLAIPFVFLGQGALQNFFWITLFIISMSIYWQDSCKALVFFWLITILSPAILYSILVGSDYIANSLFVLLPSFWLVVLISRSDIMLWGKFTMAIFLGVSLSSRANFIFILPLLFSALFWQIGWQSIKYFLLVSLTFLLVTLPFFIYDPQSFSPLHTANKLNQFQILFPHTGTIILILMASVSLILALQDNSNPMVFLRNCAITLAVPVLCGVLLRSIMVGHIDFSFASFGQLLLFFAAVPFWDQILKIMEISTLQEYVTS